MHAIQALHVLHMTAYKTHHEHPIYQYHVQNIRTLGNAEFQVRMRSLNGFHYSELINMFILSMRQSSWEILL